jgi:2-dehydro-3-deoxy-L-rhamnonate dehydrogenase (NAD+)
MSEPKATYRRVTVMENCEMAANGRFDAMTALITGGASGIGCAVASRVIAEGGLVTLWDVDQAKLDAAQAKFGPKVRAKRVDI